MRITKRYLTSERSLFQRNLANSLFHFHLIFSQTGGRAERRSPPPPSRAPTHPLEKFLLSRRRPSNCFSLYSQLAVSPARGGPFLRFCDVRQRTLHCRCGTASPADLGRKAFAGTTVALPILAAQAKLRQIRTNVNARAASETERNIPRKKENSCSFRPPRLVEIEPTLRYVWPESMS